MMKSVKGLSDEALVELVRTKDQELYAEVVRRYQDKLIRYAIFLIQDEDKAADVVQEAFIKAFTNLQGFDIKRKFSSWIYRIAHNEAINYLKKYAKEISLENHQGAEQLLKGNSLETDYDRKELKQMLEWCLDELPLKYRSALCLFYFENRSYEEISDVLRLPVGTVGTWINRGKKLLAAICKRKGGEIYVKS